jgi:hypothetical protein
MVMFGIPIRVPFLIVMLLAGLWIFAMAWWKPELLEQKPTSRFYISILESLVCGFLWGAILAYLSDDPIEGLVLSSILVGFFWFSIVFYSRHRYARVLEQSPSTRQNPERYRQ